MHAAAEADGHVRGHRRAGRQARPTRAQAQGAHPRPPRPEAQKHGLVPAH
ncbi:MAG: hypothetical protein MZV49_10705 [Rhodopseudomonas palustris]|nr:hypothetical protein [Rhodopseudomonas palustris]